MRIGALLILLLSLTSCSTFKENRRIKKCAKYQCIGKDSLIIKDSISYKTVIDSFYHTEKAETVYLPSICDELCDSLGNLKPFKREVKNGSFTTTIKSVGNSLAVDCALDSLLLVNEYQEKEIFRLKQEVITKGCSHKEPSAFKQAFSTVKTWWFLISWLSIILYLIFKLYRNKLPF